MKWFIIFTRPNCEMSVSKALTRKKITNYCPLTKSFLPGHQTLQNAEVPLFKSYVFVKIAENQLVHLRLQNGVINFLYCLDKPVEVDESEISIIKKFTAKYINVRIEKTGLNEGNRVIFNDSSPEEPAIRVALPSLCCNIIGEVAPAIIKSRSSFYPMKFLRLRPQYMVKTLLIVCIKLISDI